MRVRSLGLEKPLEEGMTTHSSILAWGIPWMEEPGGLRFIGSQRVRRDQSDLAPVPWLQVLSGFSCPLSGPESSPPRYHCCRLPGSHFSPTDLSPTCWLLLALHDPGHLPSEMSLPLCPPHLLISPSACFIFYCFLHLSLFLPPPLSLFCLSWDHWMIWIVSGRHKFRGFHV